MAILLRAAGVAKCASPILDRSRRHLPSYPRPFSVIPALAAEPAPGPNGVSRREHHRRRTQPPPRPLFPVVPAPEREPKPNPIRSAKLPSLPAKARSQRAPRHRTDHNAGRVDRGQTQRVVNRARRPPAGATRDDAHRLHRSSRPAPRAPARRPMGCIRTRSPLAELGLGAATGAARRPARTRCCPNTRSRRSCAARTCDPARRSRR